MTGKDILVEAMTLMMIPSESLLDYTPYVLPAINGLLPELYSINTLLCLSKGYEEEKIPPLTFLSDIEETILLEREVLSVLSVGVCIHLSTEDEDEKSAYFSNLYEGRKGMVSCTMPIQIKDVYS